MWISSASPGNISSRPGQRAAISAERGQASLVALDRDHLFCALREQRARQATRSGADFDDDDAGQRSGGARDATRKVEIEQEILSERLLGVQAVRGDDLAQRREAVVGQRHPESRAASRVAAIRLEGLANPLPAMSNAVP